MMQIKFLHIVLLLISLQSFGQGNLFVFPEPVDTADFKNCKVIEPAFKKVLELASFGRDSIYVSYSQFEKIDLNNDGQCEVIHYYLNRVMGNYDFITIYQIYEDDEVKELGTFTNHNFSFAKSENTYLDIIQGYFKGHKTNPTYYSKVLSFNGSKYEESANPEITKQEYEQNGLKFYKARKYEIASKYFWNALRTPHHNFIDELKDANNLAIAWIKMNRGNEVISLLTNYVEGFDHDYYSSKELAPTLYNLGLAEEQLKNYRKAQENYKLSCKYKSTDGCISKVKKMEETLANNR